MVTYRRSAGAQDAPLRARSPDDKEARRRALLAAAWERFRATEYEAITVAEVAARAGLAKGTVYLYFRTREELFLGVAVERLGEWIDALDERLDAGRGTSTIARAFTETLRPRADLLRLVAILHAILERNVEEGPIVQFKRAMLARIAATGARLERRLPVLAPGDGGRLLLRIYALIIGLWQLARPGATVRRVLEAPDLAAMRLDFEVELEETIAAMVAGLDGRGGRR